MVIAFCFYHFLIGHLWAEILTVEFWRKWVKSWRAPIFCDISAWRAGTNELVQCGREFAHKSWPSCNRSLGDYMRWIKHLGEHQRGLGEASYCRLCRAKPVRRYSTGCVHNLRMRQHFVDAYILLTHIFCQRPTFVDANVLLTPILSTFDFFDTWLLSTPTFCRRLTFVDANILSTLWRIVFS